MSYIIENYSIEIYARDTRDSQFKNLKATNLTLSECINSIAQFTEHFIILSVNIHNNNILLYEPPKVQKAKGYDA